MSPWPPDPWSYNMCPPPRGCVPTETKPWALAFGVWCPRCVGALTCEVAWIPEWERFQKKTQAESTAIPAASAACSLWARCARDEQARKGVSPRPLPEGMLLCGGGSEDAFGTYRDHWGVSLPLMAGGQMEQLWPEREPSATSGSE